MDRGLLKLNDFTNDATEAPKNLKKQAEKYWKYAGPIFGYLAVLLVGVLIGHFGDAFLRPSAMSNRASVELNRPHRKYGEGHELSDFDFEPLTEGNAYELSKFEVYANHEDVDGGIEDSVVALRNLYGGLFTVVDHNHVDMNGHYKDDSQNWIVRAFKYQNTDGYLFESLGYKDTEHEQSFYLCAKNMEEGSEITLQAHSTIFNNGEPEKGELWKKQCMWSFFYEAECEHDGATSMSGKSNEQGKDYKRLYFHIKLTWSDDQCVKPIHDSTTNEDYCFACDHQVVIENCTGCLSGFNLEYYEKYYELEERLEGLLRTKKAIEHEKGQYAQSVRRERRKDRQDAEKAMNRPNSFKNSKAQKLLADNHGGSKPLKHGLPGDERPWRVMEDENDEEEGAANNVIHVVVED